MNRKSKTHYYHNRTWEHDGRPLLRRLHRPFPIPLQILMAVGPHRIGPAFLVHNAPARRPSADRRDTVAPACRHDCSTETDRSATDADADRRHSGGRPGTRWSVRCARHTGRVRGDRTVAFDGSSAGCRRSAFATDCYGSTCSTCWDLKGGGKFDTAMFHNHICTYNNRAYCEQFSLLDRNRTVVSSSNSGHSMASSSGASGLSGCGVIGGIGTFGGK